MTSQTIYPDAPKAERMRHNLKRRSLAVSTVERVTPNMLRITLTGPDLADFPSAAPDDHVKIFIDGVDGQPQMRDYTPRRFNRDACELVLDFALHEAGPATAWALSAKPGDPLTVGGPRGSLVLSPEIKRFLLIGDETALPAIGRRIEEAGADVEITAYVAVTGPGELQVFDSRADVALTWVYRPAEDAASAQRLLGALEGIVVAPGTYVWIAAEASVARAVRTHLVESAGYPLAWIKASGYWLLGQPDAHEKLD
ncbi:siderophore-interacting protein [Rhizobium sp. G21]|uniref:siderophore-interacting protein n=1 Tax=Rhizobium sp. G21 TaxID=2758439 RepID=UPI0016013B27|nr:siderophore-interacting protein [Rhizobium sp. G21]MBB1249338.1 siderophore-interacting protein [Rhizobium sp. G21]